MFKKLCCVFISILTFVSLCGCSESIYERDINTCKGCGKSFYAGDAAGNYKNITWTNLCNKCEAEVKAYSEIKDYLELN